MAMTPSSAPPLRCEPAERDVAIARHRARAAGRATAFLREEVLERLAALGAAARRVSDLPPSSSRSNSHQLGRVSGGELADPAFRRMQAQLQRFERERVVDRDDELAVEQEMLRPSLARASRPPRENSGRAACPTWTSA